MFSLIQIPSLRWIPNALTSTQLESDTLVQENEKVLSSEDIRYSITDLLSQYHIPFSRTPYDRDLYDLCIQECKLKKYPIYKTHGKPSILKYIPSGVIIASTAYAHLKTRSTHVFIAIYTAFLMWVEDTYTGNVPGLDAFNERFITGQSQANEGVDGFARLLRETDLHYYGVQANIILTSSLNFVTAIILKFNTQKGMTVSPHAKSYAISLHVMSGAAEAYSMFVFPAEVPIKLYIQAIPEICLAIGYFNDVLSFYKEDEARLQREKKNVPVSRQLVNEALLSLSRIKNTLEVSGEANDTFQYFIRGYVSFHASFESRHSPPKRSVSHAVGCL